MSRYSEEIQFALDNVKRREKDLRAAMAALSKAALAEDEPDRIHVDVMNSTYFLVLEESDYHNREVGDWLPSSESC